MLAALIAEFVGTFALIFVGAGAIINNGALPDGLKLGLTGIALAHGLTIAVMASATGHVSGGHLNPAVTSAFVATGKMPAARGAAFIAAQLLGGLVAALVLKAVFPAAAVAAAQLGTPLLAGGVSAWKGVLVEAILTFFLVFVIFGTAVDARAARVGALFIGLTIALDILVGGPLTGAAMNPARSLGPALAGGYLQGWWVYWLGPILGAVAAGLLYTKVFQPRETS